MKYWAQPAPHPIIELKYLTHSTFIHASSKSCNILETTTITSRTEVHSASPASYGAHAERRYINAHQITIKCMRFNGNWISSSAVTSSSRLEKWIASSLIIAPLWKESARKHGASTDVGILFESVLQSEERHRQRETERHREIQRETEWSETNRKRETDEIRRNNIDEEREHALQRIDQENNKWRIEKTDRHIVRPAYDERDRWSDRQKDAETETEIKNEWKEES